MSETSYALPGPSINPDGSDTAGIADSINTTRSNIWFEDGNIIFQAQMTQFRVHKGILGRHSSVFKDMLSVPQPSGEITSEGFPIVHLADRPEDWQNVLITLYDGSLKAYKSVDNMAFSMAESLLRLGKKYEFDNLYGLAIENFRATRPRTLDLWEKKYIGQKRPNSTTFHDFDLVNLLVDSGIKSLLPTSLYACLEGYSLEEILRGSTRLDGTPVHLSPNTQITLVLGKEKLLKSTTEYIQDWLTTEGICSDPVYCGPSKARCLAFMVRYPFLPNAVVSPYLLDLTRKASAFCDTCKRVMCDKIEVGREKLWDELPGFFSLQGWADLEDN
ncbi:hypothetical protein GALMADRAFT_255290 [Galerina marginata CBS 339.88]|uniref:BTB domain-containing protein n=1 Tax=Galerina marginata (strain CBS 339.88) TaxID=685588 RepID=A0A067STA5_GALM3|nr:hypothetical protein GALMADRAFT_255290 [Galerina marginata CBS 339.88]